MAAAPGPAVTPLRILVAEDNEFNVRHLQRLLGKKGHHVRLANNGREALALLGIEGPGSGIEGPLVPDIDVLLLDLHMPELDGFQVVRAIRERERAAGGHLPVIALTALAAGRPREVPGRRHGRLPHEADPGGGTVRDDRASGLRLRRAGAMNSLPSTRRPVCRPMLVQESVSWTYG